MLSQEFIKYLNSLQAPVKKEDIKAERPSQVTPMFYLLLKTNAQQKIS